MESLRRSRSVRFFLILFCAFGLWMLPLGAAQAATLVTQEDFEDGFSSYWYRAMNDYSYSGNFSSNHSVSPSYAYRFEVHSTDDPIEDGMRSELEGSAEEPLLERTYDFSVYLPDGGAEDYATDTPGAGEVIMQWHNNPDEGEEWTRPPLALFTDTRSDGTGYYYLLREWDEDPISTDEKLEAEDKLVEYDLGSYEGDKGRWVRWTFHVKWGWLASQNPKLEVYKDGALILNLNGLPNTTNDDRGVNQQFGMYKWAWNERDLDAGSRLTKRVIYFDNVSVYEGNAVSSLLTASVSTPAFSPQGGSYTSAQSVSISSATSGATIYYTTDGTVPTFSSTVYSGSISVSSSKTVKAIATKSGMTNSSVSSATYIINLADTTVPTIVISSPTSGQMLSTASMTVSGTASDNVALSKVEVRLGSGNYQTAAGTTNWSLPLILAAGSNTITARSTDSAGNTKTATVTVTYTAPTYALTVTNGTGDGSYASGTSVTVTANAPAAGKVFDRWTGDTSYIASATSATTTVTMPAKAIVLTATYKDAPVATYALTVNYGTGDGSYAQGTNVTITANAPTVGKLFDKWTGDIAYLTSVSSSSTTVAMPAKPITLTAVYKDITTYALTVTKGTGDGLYASGAKITIKADTAPSGQTFVKWTGDTAYLSSTTSSTATVTMPNKAINLTATYTNSTTPVEKMYYLLIVNQGTGSEAYEAGTKVNISANLTISELIFDKWTGDTSYLDDPTKPTTTVTMPGKHIGVTATFKNAPLPETYLLTVNSGSGDGEYEEGDKVTIKADAAPSGKAFDRWEGATTYLSASDSLISVVTMPAKPITLTATYKDASSDNPATTINLPDGTLVKLPDSPKVYVIIDGEKKWISTPEQFEQLGYQWQEIETVTEEILDTIEDIEDNLIRLLGDFKVYLVTNGVRRHIPNPDIFLDYGFSWDDIKDVDETVVSKYKDTYLVKESGKEAVYYLSGNGVRKHIPTEKIFDSYGDRWEDVQIISKTEMESYPISDLIQLQGSNQVYLVSANAKKLIPDAATFNRKGYDWNHVISVNKTEFDYYQDGGTVK